MPKEERRVLKHVQEREMAMAHRFEIPLLYSGFNNGVTITCRRAPGEYGAKTKSANIRKGRTLQASDKRAVRGVLLISPARGLCFIASNIKTAGSFAGSS